MRGRNPPASGPLPKNFTIGNLCYKPEISRKIYRREFAGGDVTASASRKISASLRAEVCNIHAANGGCYNCGMLIDRIPHDLLAQYKRHEISSSKLAEVVGCHPQSLRRAIPRPKRVKQPTNKTELLRLRHTFRMTLGHLPISEIAERASVSTSTARRIKEQWSKQNA